MQVVVPEVQYQGVYDMRATHRISPPRRILLAAGDVEMRSWFARTLSHSGYDVGVFGGSTKSLESLATMTREELARFELMICQAELLDEAGSQVLAQLQEQSWLPPLMLLRRLAGLADADLVRRLSVSATIDSTFDAAKQLAFVRSILPVARPSWLPYSQL